MGSKLNPLKKGYISIYGLKARPMKTIRYDLHVIVMESDSILYACPNNIEQRLVTYKIITAAAVCWNAW